MKGHPPTECCKTCKGECCKAYAGSACPDDFGITNSEDAVESIYFLLKSQKWAVDCWVADPEILYLRPAHTNRIGAVIDESWGGTCVCYTDTGCSLSFEARPIQCRMLKAKENKEDHCVIEEGYGKYECAMMWKSFQKEILEAVKRVNQES